MSEPLRFLVPHAGHRPRSDATYFSDRECTILTLTPDGADRLRRLVATAEIVRREQNTSVCRLSVELDGGRCESANLVSLDEGDDPESAGSRFTRLFQDARSAGQARSLPSDLMRMLERDSHLFNSVKADIQAVCPEGRAPSFRFDPMNRGKRSAVLRYGTLITALLDRTPVGQRGELFEELVRMDPPLAARWLEESGARRALADISPDLLVGLLEDDRDWVREVALAAMAETGDALRPAPGSPGDGSRAGSGPSMTP